MQGIVVNVEIDILLTSVIQHLQCRICIGGFLARNIYRQKLNINY